MAEFFEYGHTFDELENMCYWNFLYMINACSENNKRKHRNMGSSTGAKKLRPVQRDALQRLKDLKKK